MSIALRVAPLVFVAAVFQVGAISGIRVLGAEPDVLLVTVVVVGLVAGSLAGAGAGFAGGILFDSMTLGRPYRQPMSRPEALEELRRCAGSQFDGRVVEAFVQVLEAQGDGALIPAPEAAKTGR